ncbi:MAG TPA: cupredoxin domain-containing protein [Thermoanaerobaculia bacterium]|nr:cupredoxin domain-containing protein [Thermoanaerobaculia bacterium]
MNRLSCIFVVVALAVAGAAFAGGSDVQEFTVKVAGNYSPAEITVTEGTPVRINFIRESAANCGGKVVFPELGFERDLPAGKTTIVEFLPKKSGALSFTCGMGMMKGSIVVNNN